MPDVTDLLSTAGAPARAVSATAARARPPLISPLATLWDGACAPPARA